jgi:hypothetical protein
MRYSLNPNFNKQITLLLALCFCALQSYGRFDPPQINGVYGGSSAINSVFSYYDATLYPGGAYTAVSNLFNKTATNIIMLSINPDIANTGTDLYMGTAFTATFHFTVAEKDETGSAITGVPPSVDLTVDYNPAANTKYTDKAVYTFTGAYYTQVSVSSVDITIAGTTTNYLQSGGIISGSPILNFLQLTGELDVERYATNFNAATPAVISVPGLVSCTGEIKIQWVAVPEAEEYDLEWTYVDETDGTLTGSRSTTGILYDWNNASMVTITGTSYSISNVFDRGYILFRVRAVGRKSPNYNWRVEGAWSDQNFLTPDIANFISATTSLPHFCPSGTLPVGCTLTCSTSGTPGLIEITDHEANKNWQFLASYAEEGKKKEVINYFDGSLRNRQTVTKDRIYTNRTNIVQETIIAETIYDNQGRPAIHIIPVPNPDANSILKYYANFNVNTSGQAYSRIDFDNQSSCPVSTRAGIMGTGSGASQYFSSGNPNQNEQQAFLPDAEGYPFSQTVYTPDGTGRIKAQGNVGKALGIGIGHESKYYYGSPLQDELDRLFGSEVGLASQYKKNMVIDPNGQAQVSYINQEGKVVATCLAGPAPANLSSIYSGTNEYMSADLLTRNKVSYDGKTLTLSYPILVRAPTNYTFLYDFDPQVFSDACIDLCMQCSYSVSVSVKDECGIEKLPHTMPVTVSGYNLSCGTPSHYHEGYIGVPLSPGQYTVYKNLSIDEAALNRYAQYYANQMRTPISGCDLHDSMYFINKYLDAIDYTDCATCGSCNPDSLLMPQDSLLMTAMLNDVTPGGQYAQYQDYNTDGTLKFNSDGTPVYKTYDLSVLNDRNKLTSNLKSSWRDPDPAHPYVNEDYSLSVVTLDDGRQYNPQNLPEVTDFIKFWKPEWAHSLVIYHPEYPYYQWLVTNRSSQNWDSWIAGLNYEQAKTAGIINTSGVVVLFSSDPFFNSTGLGNNTTARNSMTNGFTPPYSYDGHHGLNNYNNGYAIEDFIRKLEEKALGYTYSSSGLFQSVCYDENEWELYKTMYFAEKHRVFLETMHTWLANSSNCSHCGANAETLHGCIGIKDPSCLAEYAGKIKRYENDNDLQSLFKVSDVETDLYNKTNNFNSHTVNEIANMCSKQCESYVPQWRMALSHCGLSSAQMDALMASLVNICENGCDENNPLGARTDKALTTSFNAALTAALNAAGLKMSDLCNDLLLEMPLSYNQNYFAGNAPLPYMDACGCDKILTVDALPGLTDDQKTVIFNTNYGASITDFRGKACICANALAMGPGGTIWSQKGIQYLESLSVPMDPSLTCNRCVSCQSVLDGVIAFNDTYRYFEDSTSYDQALATYLNSTLSMNLSAFDYYDFMNECKSVNSDIFCTVNTDIKTQLQSLFNALSTGTTIPLVATTSAPYDLTSSITSYPALYTPVTGCTPIHYFRVTTDITSSYTLSGEITDACNFTAKFTLIAPYPINYNNISAFTNLVPEQTTIGKNYTFTIDGTYGGGTITLRGVTNAFDIESCTYPDVNIRNRVDRTVTADDLTATYDATQQVTIPSTLTAQYDLDKCGCNKLYALNEKWLNRPTTIPDVPFGAYVAKYYGYRYEDVDDISMALGACDKAYKIANGGTPPVLYTWHPETPGYKFSADPSIDIGSSLASMHYKVPAFLHCDNCTSCDAVDRIVTDFNTNAFDHKDVFKNEGMPYYLHGTNDYINSLRKFVLSRYSGSHIAVYPLSNSPACTTCVTSALTVCDFTKQAEDLAHFLNTDHSNLLSSHPVSSTFYDSIIKESSLFQTESVCASTDICSSPTPGYNYNLITSIGPGVMTLEFEIDGCGLSPVQVPHFSITSTRAFDPAGPAIQSVELTSMWVDADNVKGSKIIMHLKVHYVGTGITDEWTVASLTPGLIFANCCPSRSICNKPLLPGGTVDVNFCAEAKQNLAIFQAQQAYAAYVDSVLADFRRHYITHCMGGIKEAFKMEFQPQEYQYTLYYYDQAGDLIKTVPPEGVNPIILSDNSIYPCPTCSTGFYSQKTIIDTNRYNPALFAITYPAHTLITNYRYNSLRNITQENSPDGGTKSIWYDVVGRAVVSQSANQAADIGGDFGSSSLYSYILYDPIGRTIEAGQMEKLTVHCSSLPSCSSYNYCGIDRNLARNATCLADWLSDPNAKKKQVTQTYYDAPMNSTITARFGSSGQVNLRNRVSSVTYADHLYGVSTGYYNYASHYSYDLHGNVQLLIQEDQSLADIGQSYKRMDYDYDLISGKVNKVTYQAGQPDQFIHKYTYDDENRLISAFTSRDNVLWDEDAYYKYYLHGANAREEIGDQKVQGIDYAYTLQGWIKGVNSNILESNYDMGTDGNGSGSHSMTARDAFGYSLSYYSGSNPASSSGYIDYKQIASSSTHFLAEVGSGSTLDNASYDLYNGNIRHMVTSIAQFGNPVAMAYSYDQLNRLTNVSAYRMTIDGISANSWNSSAYITTGIGYDQQYTYDRNGNILSQLRNGPSTLLGLDNLTYHYTTGTNQLNYVHDAVSASNYADDIDDQAANNYGYDPNGNMIRDDQERISSISWSAYGKIMAVNHTSGYGKTDLRFYYGPDQNRLIKADETHNVFNYYVRDAQGNIMAVYKRTLTPQSTTTPGPIDYPRLFALMHHYYSNMQIADFIGNHSGVSSSTGYLSYFNPPVLSTTQAADVLHDQADVPGLTRFYAYDPSINATLFSGGISPFDEVKSVIYGGNMHYITDVLFNRFPWASVVSVNGQMLTNYYVMNDCSNYIAQCAAGDPLLMPYLFTHYGLGTPPPSLSVAATVLCSAPGVLPTLATELMNYDITNGTFDRANGLNLYTNIVSMYNNMVTVYTTADFNNLQTGLSNIMFNPNFIVDLLDAEPFGHLALLNAYQSGAVSDAQMNSAISGNTQLQIYAILYTEPFTIDYGISWLQSNYAISSFLMDLQNYSNTIDGGAGYSFIYNYLTNSIVQTYNLEELDIYGTSRAGTVNPDLQLYANTFTGTVNPDGKTEPIYILSPYTAPTIDASKTKRLLGNKSYELSNHLGNVLVTVSDRKISHSTGGVNIDYYTADIQTAQDYYAFGAPISDRTYSASGVISRFGFNKMEKDDEINGKNNNYTAAFWEYDSRLGRRWNLDPISQEFESKYVCFHNNPIFYSDPSGLDPEPNKHKIKRKETFWGIANKSNGQFTVNDLLEWNQGIDPKKLKIGSEINISDPEDEPVNTPQNKTINTIKFNGQYYPTIYKKDWATAEALFPVSIRIANIPEIGDIVAGLIVVGGFTYCILKPPKAITMPIAIPVTITIPDKSPRIYVTYTKYNPLTGETYAGRASGYGDPYSIIRIRDYSHHMNELGFGPAILDRWVAESLPFGPRQLDPAYQAIRGREQILIDFYGGSWLSNGGRHQNGTRSGNAINGISKYNPLYDIYMSMGRTL